MSDESQWPPRNPIGVAAYGAPSVPYDRPATQPGQSSGAEGLSDLLKQSAHVRVESRDALVSKVMVLIAEALVPLTPVERERVIQAYASRYGGSR